MEAQPAQTQQLARLREEKSRARRKKSEPGFLTNLVGKQARQTMLGIGLASGASNLSAYDQYQSTRAQARAEASLSDLSPAAERFAANGNLSAEQAANAREHVTALYQQARVAEDLATLQAINYQIETINDDLTEAGIEDEQLKIIDNGRRWLWRGINLAGPAIDDLSGGATFGAGTILTDLSEGYQIMAGRFLRDRPEPVTGITRLFVPPPIRPLAPPNESFLNAMMRWWDKAIWPLLDLCIQHSLGIGIGLVVIASAYIIYNCATGGISPADNLCLSFGETLLQLVGATNN